MNDIEQKALIERLRQRSNSNYMPMTDPPKPAPDRDCHAAADLLEQLLPIAQEFDGFRQEVSDAVGYVLKFLGACHWAETHLNEFIIPKPKPDPLFDVMWDLGMADNRRGVEFMAARINEALEARGLEIREKEQ